MIASCVRNFVAPAKCITVEGMSRRSEGSILGRLRAPLSGAASLLALLGTNAFAQLPDAIEVDGELSVVAGGSDGETDADIDARVSATGSTVLRNGMEIGAAASMRADSDAPASQFGGGRYSSLLFGGPRGFGGGDGDVFLEDAYVFARGGFGSVYLGRDAGIASRLAVTSPTIFSSIGVNDWRTDITGLNDVHTVNDFSGQATKLTYMPPVGFLVGSVVAVKGHRMGRGFTVTVFGVGCEVCEVCGCLWVLLWG